MKKKYLIDTCIWRDFYEDRIDNAGKLLGKIAAELFFNIISHKDIIIYSEALIRELKNDYPETEINDIFGLLLNNKLLNRIEITNEEYLAAKRISIERNIPFIDSLNAIHARNHNAILVTRDKHYFENLSDIIIPYKPEDIN
jgi:predicted nucleic acid-binding protein